MAQLRERGSQQIEILLERRHLILLGLCVLLLGSLLFLLGMLTQRTLLARPGSSGVVAQARKPAATPPSLFPDRSAEPNVRSQDFEFYESLGGGAQGKDKDRKERSAQRGDLVRTAAVSGGAASRIAAAPASAQAGRPARTSATGTADAKRPAAAAATASAAAAEAKKAEAKKAVDKKADAKKLDAKKAEDKKAEAKKSDARKTEAKQSEAKKAEPPAAGADSPATGPGYALQVAALSDKQSAQDHVKRLRAKGYPAFVDAGRLENGKLVFRVKVGNYASRDEARQAASRLKTETGKEIWIHRAAEG